MRALLFAATALLLAAPAWADEPDLLDDPRYSSSHPSSRPAVPPRPARAAEASPRPVRISAPVDLSGDPEYAAGRRKQTAGIVVGSVVGGPGLVSLAIGLALVNPRGTGEPHAQPDPRVREVGWWMLGLGAGALVVAAVVAAPLIYVGNKQMERRRATLLAPRVSFAPTPGGAEFGLGWTY
jgi:hypothetical protein